MKTKAVSYKIDKLKITFSGPKEEVNDADKGFRKGLRRLPPGTRKLIKRVTPRRNRKTKNRKRR